MKAFAISWYMRLVVPRFCPCRWRFRSRRLVDMCQAIDLAWYRANR